MILRIVALFWQRLSGCPQYLARSDKFHATQHTWEAGSIWWTAAIEPETNHLLSLLPSGQTGRAGAEPQIVEQLLIVINQLSQPVRQWRAGMPNLASHL